MKLDTVRSWYSILNGTYSSEKAPVEQLDPVSRWLIATRSVVFVLTATSVILGGLLAKLAGILDFGLLLLILVGLVLAHAGSNLFNDYWDTKHEIDTSPGYLRMSYLPHPILSGMMSPRGLFLLGSLHALGVVAIAAYLTLVRGPIVIALTGVGLLIVVLYAGGPVPLKRIGLGEPAVFIVWGPLMVGGTFYVLTGILPGWVILASVPQAAMVTTVLLGKHIDKLDSDREIGVNTIPVLLGERYTRILLRVLVIAAYLSVLLLVLPGILPLWSLISFLALARARSLFKLLSAPKPRERPEGYPLWPVYFLGQVFIHNRRFGSLYILSLIVGLVIPVNI